MGIIQGLIGRGFVKFGNMTRQEVEGKKFTAAVTFFGGYLYGEYKGGRYRDSQTRELMDRVWGDYERRKMEYEAKAREVGILGS